MRRKDFLKLSAASASFLGVNVPIDSINSINDFIEDQNIDIDGSCSQLTHAPIDKVKVGIIGLGNRGSVLVKMFNYLIKNNLSEIIAISDLNKSNIDRNLEYINSIQNKSPDLYYNNNNSWRELVLRDDIDLVIIATPWDVHADMSIYSMNNGKHVACEVPIANNLKDCWEIIKVAESTKRHCLMMENCCFNNEELWILNMIDKGVFGSINHSEGAYIHDLRKHLLDEKYYHNHWRIKEHQKRNGNLYPTHGLGPVCSYMNIGRGDNFDHLVSMSSSEESLGIASKSINSQYKDFLCGDMNTTLIKTKKGKTIKLQFDVHTGRPYTRLNNVNGTKAVHQGYPSKLYINNPELHWSHGWLDEQEYLEYRDKYNHPLWEKMKKEISNNRIGHGGMDFVMIYRLISCLNRGLPLDIDVYDSVLWSSIVPLSELSVLNKSKTINIPDFTGGNWKNSRKTELLRVI